MRGSLVQGAWGMKGLWAVVTGEDLSCRIPGRREKSGVGGAWGLEQAPWVDSGDVSEGNLCFVTLRSWTDPQLHPGSYSFVL